MIGPHASNLQELEACGISSESVGQGGSNFSPCCQVVGWAIGASRTLFGEFLGAVPDIGTEREALQELIACIELELEDGIPFVEEGVAIDLKGLDIRGTGVLQA